MLVKLVQVRVFNTSWGWFFKAPDK